MANSVQYYQALTTSAYQESQNFQATIALSVSVYCQIQSLLDSMIPLFDLNTPPVGNQLDIIGQWVGVSRNIAIPIAGTYFTWDGAASLGWDFGSWAPLTQQTSITVLPDDAYLTLILAKIAANHWDGTTEGAYAIWAQLFPQYTLLISDYQNMSFSIAIQGAVPDTLTLALLTGGYLPLRPEGVEITSYFIPIDTSPLFAWDADSASLQGWDTGAWAVELTPT